MRARPAESNSTVRERGGATASITSVQAIANEPNISVYAATKAGILGLTRGLAIDFEAHSVTIDGADAGLTSTEHKILRELVRSKGRVLQRDRLLDTVWDTDFDGTSRTVDTHMRRLRGKLGPYADWIETVRGVGYRLAPDG